MARKSKSHSSFLHFLTHTRPGFYILVFAAIIGFTTTINAFRASDEQSSVLAAQDNRGRAEEIREEKEIRQEEHKQELEQRFNVNPDELRMDIKPKQNKVTREIKHKQEELNLGGTQDSLIEEIEEEFEEVESAEIATDGSKIVIEKNRVEARTGFPLSIDVATGQLIVTRPDGTQKLVTVLPDQAIRNFQRHKKIELITPAPLPGNEDNQTGTDSAGTDSFGIQSVELGEVPETKAEPIARIEIVERDDQLVYEIKGKRKIKILGFIPAETSITGYVSTETGDVVGETQPFFDRILHLISIHE